MGGAGDVMTQATIAAPARRHRPRGRVLPYLLSLPALLICIGILIPFATAVWYSMQRYNLAFPMTRGMIWWGNYLDFLSDPSFWNTLKVSIAYMVLTVGVELLLGLGVALLLRRSTVFNNIMSIALMLPLMIAPAIAALMWKLMTNPDFGILSYLVGLVGLHDFKWASAPSTALLTVVLVDVWVYTPFIIILLLAGLRALPTQPFEAADLDGVPRSFVFFRITLADADALYHHRSALPHAGRHPAVRHHLCHDPGGPGRPADGLPGPGLSRLLPEHQCRAVRRFADDPLGHHLRPQQSLHQTLAAPARAGARGEMSMRKTNPIARALRAAALLLVGLFFLFPIFWVLLMSFQTNQDILRIPPSLFFSPTLENFLAIISGKLVTSAGTLEVPFMGNLLNSVILSTASVAVSLLLGVPAAYAFARFRFRLGENIAFTLLSFRFAPPLLVVLPLALYFQDLGLNNSYLGLVWVYQLISLPLILWIVRGYFEDMSPDIEHAFRIDGHSWFATFMKVSIPLARPGIAAAALLAFIFCWNNFIFALILASADKQPVTVGALAFVTASGIQYGQIAASIVLSIIPTLALALYAQRYLVEGLSLGAVKG